MELGFPEGLLIAGALLLVAAALSGVTRGTVLSISVLSVAVGAGLAAADVVSFDPRDESVVHLIELALVLTLLSDGLVVERELLLAQKGAPLRALCVAMPVTLVLLAGAAKLLFPELAWAEAFLLGAVLSATDPVVTSVVVTARKVPALVRHTLNLESGLNDGLALPFVLFFLVLAAPGGDAGEAGLQLLGEACVGAAIGAALGFAAGRLRPVLPGGGITKRYEGIYALGVGMLAYGLAEVTFGNGLVAVFVAGIALGVARHEVPESLVEFNENLSAIFQVLTLFVFGAIMVDTNYAQSVPALAVFVAFTMLAARPIAIGIAFLRSRIPRPQKAFIGWFGPKGVAGMLFALLVLDSEVPDRILIFQVAAFTILASILLHGLTDTLGASWIERKMAERDGPEEESG